jgi:hypothetical protein
LDGEDESSEFSPDSLFFLAVRTPSLSQVSGFSSRDRLELQPRWAIKPQLGPIRITSVQNLNLCRIINLILSSGLDW